MVTPRLQPLWILGKTRHQIAIPIHFGYAGEIAGSSINELTAIVSDPNVSMHEAKAFTCQIRKGRLARPSDIPSTPVAPRPQQGPMPATDAAAQPEGRKA
jgi:formate dehydrogenase major subunit